jgi:hypothetical protein
VSEQRFNSLSQVLLSFTSGVEIIGALGPFELERGMKDPLDPTPQGAFIHQRILCSVRS